MEHGISSMSSVTYGPSIHAIARFRLPTSPCPHSTSFAASLVSQSFSSPSPSRSLSTSATQSLTASSMKSARASTSSSSVLLGLYAALPSSCMTGIGTNVPTRYPRCDFSSSSRRVILDSPIIVTLAPTSSRWTSSTRTRVATWFTRRPPSSASPCAGGRKVTCANSPPVSFVTSSSSARNLASYRWSTCALPGSKTSSAGKSMAGSFLGTSGTSSYCLSVPV